MTKRFALGFAIAFLAFIGINLIAAHLASDCGLAAVFGRDPCADDITRAGWPLQFYEEGGFAYRSEFNPLSLFINLATGIGVAIIAGWFYARKKKTPPR